MKPTNISSATRDIPSSGAVPAHVAIIMDGNGRWAKGRGMPRIAGHRQGVEVVREMVKTCGAIGVEHLTLFAFSSENWRRPKTEVKLLLELLRSALENEVKKLHRNDVCLKVIGDLTPFPEKMQQLIVEAEALTANNSSLRLQVAINYGGRWDMMQASRKLAEAVASGELKPQDVDESVVESYLSTAGLPEPDLFIRTGGETRISNFLLWQIAYSELYFTKTLWPDFDSGELQQAIDSFANRERRFGRTEGFRCLKIV